METKYVIKEENGGFVASVARYGVIPSEDYDNAIKFESAYGADALKKAVDLIGNGIYSVYEASIKFNKVGGC